jgi:NAD(P)-dependent dehydrogenase (short-subunit alcohol dehydrogenase family)
MIDPFVFSGLLAGQSSCIALGVADEILPLRHPAQVVTADGQDLRFWVNTIAPYALTKYLLPLLGSVGRIINLYSATQAPVDLGAPNRSLGDWAARVCFFTYTH